MKIQAELAKDLYVIEKKSIVDERGLFQRIFCAEELGIIWGQRKLFQANRSINKTVGTFRGLHYQTPPFAEMKLVQCLHGKVLDIVVDLREGSTTFLQAFMQELSGKNNLCMNIPEGFAHGFQVLEPNSELAYFHSAPFNKDYDRGVNYLDPLLKIKLPLPVTEISKKDQEFPFLDKNYPGIKI